MMRQTGGCAVGETSTRSRFFSRAIFSASNGGRIPICWPSSPITRISRARMRSLMRIKRLSIQSSVHFEGEWNHKIITRSFHARDVRISTISLPPARSGFETGDTFARPTGRIFNRSSTRSLISDRDENRNTEFICELLLRSVPQRLFLPVCFPPSKFWIEDL